ncbi:hypothetical protein HPQ64_09455 [Rhizobiales bacterium]|uniref:hypothetical protein n=1 Tax=Hongsoonwoonella zoysiae TaxID=2821844 RepID=UPI0015610E55|nr:hypothetical protein [Hongsoonwoonella zoysiae]NRG17913.1 hypothetical protein [Hongsoonwoonella zoysiae]
MPTFQVPRKQRPLRLIEAEVVDPETLPPAERHALFDQLFLVHEEIFSGVDRKEFIAALVREDARRSRIQLYRNERGHIVGYCAVHVLERRFMRRTIAVLRAEAGLLPVYRGSGMTLWFGAKEAFRYKMRHPFRTVVLFTIAVHPSSFHMMSRYFWRCYPYPGRRIPLRWRKLLIFLARTSDDEPVDPGEPLILRDRWITRESGEDAAAWRKSPHEDVRYFLAINPRYHEGEGVAFLAPLSTPNLAISLLLYLWHFVPSAIMRMSNRCRGSDRSKGAAKA